MHFLRRALLVWALASATAAETNNVRSGCNVDADCSAGQRCQEVNTAGRGLVMNLINSLLGAGRGAKQCVPAESGDSSGSRDSGNNEEMQSASEFTLFGSQDWSSAINCKAFHASVPLGSSLSIPALDGVFYEKNFTASAVTVSITESRTGRRLSEGGRFSFACDAKGAFELYFNVALLCADNGNLLDDSSICSVSIDCVEVQATSAAEDGQQTPTATVTRAEPRVVCYDSPVTVNTDREITMALEHVAYSVTLTDVETGATVAAADVALTVDVRHLIVDASGQGVQTGEGMQLYYKCSSQGQHVVNIVVAAYEGNSQLHALAICPLHIQCNSESLTAKLTFPSTTGTPTTTTMAPSENDDTRLAPTTTTATTTTAMRVSSSSVEPDDRTKDTTPPVSVESTESLTADEDVRSDPILFANASELFRNIANEFETNVQLALLMNEEADADEIEKLLQFGLVKEKLEDAGNP